MDVLKFLTKILKVLLKNKFLIIKFVVYIKKKMILQFQLKMELFIFMTLN